MQKIFLPLMLSFLVSTVHAQLSYDLGNPISIAQYNQDQDMKKKPQSERDYSSCVASLSAMGLSAVVGSKILTFFAHGFPSLDKKKTYSISIGVCSSDKSICYRTDYSESEIFGFDKIGKKIMERDLVLRLGCAMSYVSIHEKFNVENLQVKLYEKTSFYKRDILIGTNYLPISRELYEKTTIVPLSSDGKASVLVRILDAK